MKLLEKQILKGTITLKTGLHIGGAKASMDIGGLDSPVIKTPDGVPYIPGSSLKGKLLSLLARDEGSDKKENDSEGLKKLFGTAGAEDDNGKIARLITRDAYLDEDSFLQTFPEKDVALETEYTEAKYENTVDRKSGSATNPRQIERVPAGTKFNFELVLDKYDEDENKLMLELIKKGFNILKDDYLGGSGSRGYGYVSIEFDDESKTLFG